MAEGKKETELKQQLEDRPNKTETMGYTGKRRFTVSALEQHQNMLKRIADKVLEVLAEQDLSAGVSLEVLDVAKARLPYRCKFHERSK